jgi:hypothetical protein
MDLAEVEGHGKQLPSFIFGKKAMDWAEVEGHGKESPTSSWKARLAPLCLLMEMHFSSPLL